jgi:hypothetical protein
MEQSFNQVNNVTLNAAGYGYCTITCPNGAQWTIDAMSVSTNVVDPTNALFQPVVRIYRDSAPNMSHFLEGTYSGNGDTSNTMVRMRGGDTITAEWTADASVASSYAGKIATFRIYGVVGGARAFF